MRKILYSIPAMLCMAACQSEELVSADCLALGTLDLSGVHADMPYVTRAVAEGLAIRLVDSNGNVVKQYASGAVPQYVELQPGTYTLIAYSDNETTWMNANGKRGEATYWGETDVTVIEHQMVACSYSVPVSNYAVSLSLPDFFSSLFSSYSFKVTSGSRTVELIEGEKAYFSPDASFTYTFNATNNDGETNSQDGAGPSSVEKGKVYNVSFGF